MNKRKKLNKLVKATSIVAFLFGIVALAFPCITSREGSEFGASLDANSNVTSISEGIHSEVVCSSSLAKAVATRSYKNANRQIENVTCDDLSIDTTNNLITLNYKLIDIYSSYSIDDSVEYEFNIDFHVNYNYESQELAEGGYFDLYFYNDYAGVDYSKTLSWQIDDFTNNTIFAYTFEVSQSYVQNNPLSVLDPTFIIGNFFVEQDQDLMYLPIPDVEIFGSFSFSELLTDIETLKSVSINNAKMGMFENATIQFGLYNVDTEVFDALPPSNSFNKISGGYITTNWGDYENYYTEASSSIRQDLIFANIASFGDGKDISPYKYIFPITWNGSNIFSFGQSLSVYFKNGYVWTEDGTSVEYGLSAFNTADMIKLSGSTIVTKIIFSGTNADYIPYGLSTSTDYTEGYDKGYLLGYENGSIGGYNNGYMEGKNDINEEKYQEGYNKGYEDATNRYSDGSLSLNGVLNAIVTAPSKIIKEGLDFELLGFNVGSLVMSLIVIGLVVWAIGFFKKG